MERTLLRRQAVDKPACGTGGVEEYDLGLHVAALFIVLVVSGGSCSFAIVVSRFPRLKISPTFLFIIRHFGTGVLLATAFVHLLPTAFLSLTDPCLPAFWNERYPAMAGAIALIGVFFLIIIEQIFSPGRHACSAYTPEVTTAPRAGPPVSNTAMDLPSGGLYGRQLSGRGHSVSRGITSVQEGSALPDDLRVGSLDQLEGPTEISSTKVSHTARQKALMQVAMLEMGILFHSVFIGMALAVATGREQVVLLIAIVFHQTFEGLALGSRIADVGWEPRAIQPWIMALLYGCTTPFGQALGIATRDLYSPNSATGLLVVGIFNAISSGFLTFNSLVDLLSEDFLSDQSWRTMRGTRRQVALVLVFFGAFCMALIGAWA